MRHSFTNMRPSNNTSSASILAASLGPHAGASRLSTCPDVKSETFEFSSLNVAKLSPMIASSSAHYLGVSTMQSSNYSGRPEIALSNVSSLLVSDLRDDRHQLYKDFE